MLYGIALADYQYMDSSVYEQWSDRDDFPVSARNYAHTVFSYDPDLEETPENVIDELDDHFGGRSNWHVDGNMAVAVDTISAWPFIVRRKVVLFVKYHDGVRGWQEKSYPVPDPEFAEVAAGYQPRKVYQDCD